MLLVVRHADAGTKGSWDGPDRLRPLSPVGRLHAEGLLQRASQRQVRARYLAPLALGGRMEIG